MVLVYSIPAGQTHPNPDLISLKTCQLFGMTPESANAVYASKSAKKMFTAFRKDSFSRLFLIATPQRAQVEVAAKAVIAKIAAKKESKAICPEMPVRKVEKRVNP